MWCSGKDHLEMFRVDAAYYEENALYNRYRAVQAVASFMRGNGGMRLRSFRRQIGEVT